MADQKFGYHRAIVLILLISEPVTIVALLFAPPTQRPENRELFFCFVFG